MNFRLWPAAEKPSVEKRVLCPGCANDRFMEVGRENSLRTGPEGVRLVPTRAVVSCYTCNREFSVRLDEPGADLVENKREKPKTDDFPLPRNGAPKEMLKALDDLVGEGPDALTAFMGRNPAARMSDGRG